jgi:hypothetical protein
MRSAFTFSRRDGALKNMVADMQRLENAARLSMGDYDGPVLLARSPVHPRHQLLLLARPGTLALIVVIAGLLTISLI